MRIRFWGVCGSCPTPVTPSALRRKIGAIIQRITPEDLESPETRETFLGNLPRELFGTIGGNTTSVEIKTDCSKSILIDAGTGLAEFVRQQSELSPLSQEYHLFLTHFHWDHIQGFPFFNPIYNPSKTIYIYSPDPRARDYLSEMMRPPFFPVPFEKLPADIRFITLEPDRKPLQLGRVSISWIARNHPQTCYAYRLEENNRIFIFSTDTELTPGDFEKTKENKEFFAGADIIVMDGQYTLGEALEKHDWGHTSFSMGIDFAIEFRIGKLYLFHHEPLYDDNRIASILRSARWYAGRQEGRTPQIEIAQEGEEVIL